MQGIYSLKHFQAHIIFVTPCVSDATYSRNGGGVLYAMSFLVLNITPRENQDRSLSTTAQRP